MENEQKKPIARVWLNGVEIGEDVTVDITMTTHASPAPPRFSHPIGSHFPMESISVTVEIKRICVPLEWTRYDFIHSQN